MTSFLILPLHVIPAGAEEASRVDTVLFSYLLHVRWPSFGVCQGSASLVVFAYKSFSIGRSWGQQPQEDSKYLTIFSNLLTVLPAQHQDGAEQGDAITPPSPRHR